MTRNRVLWPVYCLPEAIEAEKASCSSKLADTRHGLCLSWPSNLAAISAMQLKLNSSRGCLEFIEDVEVCAQTQMRL